MGCSSSIEQSPSKIKKLQAAAASGIEVLQDKKLQAAAASGVEVSHVSSTPYRLIIWIPVLLDTCIGLIMLLYWTSVSDSSCFEFRDVRDVGAAPHPHPMSHHDSPHTDTRCLITPPTPRHYGGETPGVVVLPPPNPC